MTGDLGQGELRFLDLVIAVGHSYSDPFIFNVNGEMAIICGCDIIANLRLLTKLELF